MTAEEVASITLATFLRDRAESKPIIPIPVWSIAEWLDIDVTEVTDVDVETTVSIEGVHAEIKINVNLDECVKRYALANCIGYLLVSQPKAVETSEQAPKKSLWKLLWSWFSSRSNSKTKTENELMLEFATSLLMPRNWIAADAYVHDVDHRRFARKYGVSEIAAYHRLKTLRLVP